MAEPFTVDVRTISEHLKNVFANGELGEESVIRKFRITAADGKSYLTQFYNLDAIISVGYPMWFAGPYRATSRIGIAQSISENGKGQHRLC